MKLSKKALEDFKLSKTYLDIKKVTGSTLVNFIVYHNWLNEEVECPNRHELDSEYAHEDCLLCFGSKVPRYKIYEVKKE